MKAIHPANSIAEGESFLIIHDCRGFGVDMQLPANFYDLPESEVWEQFLQPAVEQMKIEYEYRATAPPPAPDPVAAVMPPAGLLDPEH